MNVDRTLKDQTCSRFYPHMLREELNIKLDVLTFYEHIRSRSSEVVVVVASDLWIIFLIQLDLSYSKPRNWRPENLT